MIRKLFLALSLGLVVLSVEAQEKLFWEAGIDYFYENTEYINSSYRHPNTTGGVWAIATAGYAWDDAHSARVSVLGLKRQGMPEFINKVELAAYYQYQHEHFRFRVGSVPNEDIMRRYNDFFYTDSLRWHRPLMTGFTLEFNKPDVYDATIWLDWSAMATETQRESFQIGGTAQVQWRQLFADAKLRYFHYAGFNPPQPGSSIRDHGMIETTIGAKGRHSWGGLEYQVSTGVLIGLEAYRRIDYAQGNFGWLTHLDVSAFGLGTSNSLYIGEPHFGLYNEWGNDLYWGNQFLRGDKYLQNNWYIQFIKGRGIDVRLTYTLHFSEGQMFHRQALTASVDIPQGKASREERRSIFPWLAIFN